MDTNSTYTSNKLSSISGENLNVAFQYNGLGDRLSQTANGVTTYYALDQAAPLTQVLSDGTNDYLYGLDRIAQVNGSGTEYYLTDALGSVWQLTDSTGAVTLARSYQPFGTPLASAGSGASICGFTSEQQDSYIKLIFLRSRYYSPLTGTFISRDSWQGDYNRPLSLNRWLYTEGNPINRVDPSGLCDRPGWNDAPGGLFSKQQCNRLENIYLDVTNGMDYSGLQEMQDWYYRLAQRIEQDGHKQVAVNLRHFLDGSGSELQLPSEFMNDRIWGWDYVHNKVDDSAGWYIRGHLSSCRPTIPLEVGPDRYATGIKATPKNIDMWFSGN
jgi:RHS repeat-associated protein